MKHLLGVQCGEEFYIYFCENMRREDQNVPHIPYKLMYTAEVIINFTQKKVLKSFHISFDESNIYNEIYQQFHQNAKLVDEKWLHQHFGVRTITVNTQGGGNFVLNA